MTARAPLARLAALAQIAEAGREGRGAPAPMPRRTAMVSPPLADPAKIAARAAWALGDYHRFATTLVWGFGPELVEACGIGPGQRVLDVAAGSGNVALRAAQAGAEVVASDLTPENFETGRREASRLGVELDWVEADAEALPFEDAAFDVVTSSAGALFAPDHRAVARELLRVCRPGGTVGMINFAPRGTSADFFATVGAHMPPPPPPEPPVLWGDEGHVRELLGEGLASLELTRRSYVERSPGDEAAYVDFFLETFGPLVALSSDDPERAAALRRDLIAFARRNNEAPSGEPAALRYEYLLVVGRRRG